MPYFILLSSAPTKVAKFSAAPTTSFVKWTKNWSLVWEEDKTLMIWACWIKQRVKKKGSNHLLRSTWTSRVLSLSDLIKQQRFSHLMTRNLNFPPFLLHFCLRSQTLSTFPPIDFYEQHFTAKLIKRILILLILGLRRLKPNQLFFNSSSRINFDGFAFSFSLLKLLQGSWVECKLLGKRNTRS